MIPVRGCVKAADIKSTSPGLMLQDAKSCGYATACDGRYERA